MRLQNWHSSGLFLILFLLFGSTLQTWAQTEPCSAIPGGRIDNVERVFMELPWRFTLMVRRSPDFLNLERIEADYPGREVRIFNDVPEGSPLFVVRIECGRGWGRTKGLEFHLRAFTQLEGGGWAVQSGKMTNYGSTKVIE